jgi:hypothetical protein
VSKVILVARLVLPRNEPEVSTDRLGMSKAMRIIHEGADRFGGADADPRDASQSKHGRRLLRTMIQLLLDASHLPGE